MKSDLMRIAAAFDAGELETAETLLNSTGFSQGDAATHRVLLGFWRRLMMSQAQSGQYAEQDIRRLDPFFNRLEIAINKNDFWPLANTLEDSQKILGASQLSRILLSVLWFKLPEAPFGFQYDILTRAFLGGDHASHQRTFSHLLRSDKGFVPDYWQFQSLVRSWSETGKPNANVATESLIDRTDRADLKTLFMVYLSFVLQTNAEDGFQLAYSLTDPIQKERLASYLLGASQTERNLPEAVKLHEHLSQDSTGAEQNFMKARLAVATGDWSLVLDLTKPLVQHQHLKHEAICLRALAQAHVGDDANATLGIDHIRYGGHAPWFLGARASLINVSRMLLNTGQKLPNDVKSPQMRVKSGRPLAQSLWIGKKLRWIEEMSIKSYLLNGWRYQLYTYEPLENVPDGVEIMDANAILPRSAIFVEGANSGMHKGSVGAFSDLFRYALISKRGGMWTDTDVINLRRFEPDGARFISTERSDAGLIGLNGAMMAAPAGDTLQQTAFERSQKLLDRGGNHFAQIGPQLLAEHIGDQGLQGYRLLPTHFLNPIGWMETGKLLRPFEETRANPVFSKAHNIHVYTETWRLLGLSLQAPPSGDGFLAVMYDRLMNTVDQPDQTVLKLLRQ